MNLTLFLFHYHFRSSEISMMQRKLPKDDDNVMELRRLDGKVGSMLKEITSNFLILFVMLCVAFISFDENMYLQNANLKSRFVENVDPNVSSSLCSLQFSILQILHG